MSLQRPARPLPPAPAQVVETQSLEGLAAIRDEGVTLALYQRQPDPAILSFLRKAGAFAGQRGIIPAQDGSAAIHRLLDATGLPDETERKLLAADLEQLVGTFCGLTGASAARLRVDHITNDACRFFHFDYVALRMLCTYDGAGTQWLPEEALDRSGLGKGDNRLVCRDRRAIQHLRPWWVGVMKGAHWPGNDAPLVHRSPPLTPGQSRVFVAIDPADPKDCDCGC
ncbi:DUF1826 domain-containing protein [Telmatospirillum sp. J64-1]|uniref:DUF1826 domain-containing protein n=1 Tax=Telmatospirillum sp. J64-1 TaxID=2502183 RepID=UPI00115EB2FA|nr:DUF1826 domain-containing protein [Telmatospirillum sp. J64-1]